MNYNLIYWQLPKLKQTRLKKKANVMRQYNIKKFDKIFRSFY